MKAMLILLGAGFVDRRRLVAVAVIAGAALAGAASPREIAAVSTTPDSARP